MDATGIFLLIALALGLRTGAAALRSVRPHLALRCAAWLLVAVAAWLTAGLAGAFAPLWPALLVVVLGVVDRGRRLLLWVALDVLLVVALGLLSIPALTLLRIALAALLLGTLGLVADVALARLAVPLRRLAAWAAVPLAAAALAGLAFALLPPAGDDAPRNPRRAITVFSGMVPVTVPGERRLALDTGAVAWFDPARGAPPHVGVLFFHGAHPKGAHQPAALVVRRALLAAGFAVLTVDHPGYGASRAPSFDGDLAAWDPQPTDLAAYRTLAAMPGITSVIALGHSMGNLDVVNILRAEVPLASALMLGAAFPLPGQEDYWDRRFLEDRRIEASPVGLPVRDIRRRYFDIKRLARTLDDDPPPIRFLRFGIEWPDVRATRDELYALLPEPKEATVLEDTTHYLNTKEWPRLSLIVGDTRAARKLKAAIASAPARPPDAESTRTARSSTRCDVSDHC